MPSRSFITGATGLLGSHLLTALVDTGHDVVALVRTVKGVRAIGDTGALGVLGDVTKPDDLAEAMWGCDTVFHLAGVNKACARDVAGMRAANIQGAINVVRAASEAGAGRVVLTSSVAAIGEPKGSIGFENTEHNGAYVSAYAKSKHEGELAAVKAAEQYDVDLVVVNPSSVQGPGRSTGSAELILRALRSKRPWLVDVDVSVLDIDDCTRGHLLAAENGRRGERYILSGATLTVAEAMGLLNSFADVAVHPRWLNPRLVRSIGMPLSSVARTIGRSSTICPDLVRTLLHGHRYDNTKSVTELGLRYTPIEATFARTVAWFRSEGLLDT